APDGVEGGAIVGGDGEQHAVALPLAMRDIAVGIVEDAAALAEEGRLVGVPERGRAQGAGERRQRGGLRGAGRGDGSRDDEDKEPHAFPREKRSAAKVELPRRSAMTRTAPMYQAAWFDSQPAAISR